MLQYISGFIWNRHTVTVVTALINMFDAHFCSGTYFVEYNFPTSTPAQSQEDDISMATELTRIASKKLQDGGEMSVFSQFGVAFTITPFTGVSIKMCQAVH